jgi:peptidoglycan/xylan/chitin deacetylase (PgdA/CDA1 family)
VRKRLAILTFHRVLAETDAYRSGDVTAKVFDSLCACLARFFNVMPLANAARRLAEGRLPARAVSITFDDGYADNATLAVPILQRHGLSATFFVATGFLDGGMMFNDRIIEAVRSSDRTAADLEAFGLGRRELGAIPQRVALVAELLEAAKYLPVDEREARVEVLVSELGVTPPDDLMMSSTQVRELAEAGMEVGGHTVSHPILTRLATSEAAKEIARGRETLQSLTDNEICSFAYPNGRPARDYGPEHVEAVREAGFEHAVTTAWGCARADDDPLQLPRLTTWDRRALTFVPRLLHYYFVTPPAAYVARNSTAVGTHTA